MREPRLATDFHGFEHSSPQENLIVRDFDPRLALDGGEDGLRFYRQIAVEAAERLKPGGRVMLEFGDGQAALVERVFVETGWLIEAIEKDLTGRLRILIARRQEA